MQTNNPESKPSLQDLTKKIRLFPSSEIKMMWWWTKYTNVLEVHFKLKKYSSN